MGKNTDFKVKLLSVKLVGDRLLRYIRLTGRISKLENTVLIQYWLLQAYSLFLAWHEPQGANLG